MSTALYQTPLPPGTLGPPPFPFLKKGGGGVYRDVNLRIPNYLKCCFSNFFGECSEKSALIQGWVHVYSFVCPKNSDLGFKRGGGVWYE